MSGIAANRPGADPGPEASDEVYAFAGGQCDRLIRRVMMLLERQFVETT